MWSISWSLYPQGLTFRSSNLQILAQFCNELANVNFLAASELRQFHISYSVHHSLYEIVLFVSDERVDSRQLQRHRLDQSQIVRRVRYRSVVEFPEARSGQILIEIRFQSFCEPFGTNPFGCDVDVRVDIESQLFQIVVKRIIIEENVFDRAHRGLFFSAGEKLILEIIIPI